MAFVVLHRQHHDLGFFHRVQQGVGKLAKKNSANARFDLGPLFGAILDELPGVLVRIDESLGGSL
jgi:hypothetical protein